MSKAALSLSQMSGNSEVKSSVDYNKDEGVCAICARGWPTQIKDFLLLYTSSRHPDKIVLLVLEMLSLDAFSLERPWTGEGLSQSDLQSVVARSRSYIPLQSTYSPGLRIVVGGHLAP